MTLGLHLLPTRCPQGFDRATQGSLCGCDDHTTDEWQVFKAALRSAVRDDGSVHACDVRPLVRGRLAPKRIGSSWRKAIAAGLIRPAGHEESDDEAGKNAGRMEPFYTWAEAVAS